MRSPQASPLASHSHTVSNIVFVDYVSLLVRALQLRSGEQFDVLRVKLVEIKVSSDPVN